MNEETKKEIEDTLRTHYNQGVEHSRRLIETCLQQEKYPYTKRVLKFIISQLKELEDHGTNKSN